MDKYIGYGLISLPFILALIFGFCTLGFFGVISVLVLCTACLGSILGGITLLIKEKQEEEACTTPLSETTTPKNENIEEL